MLSREAPDSLGCSAETKYMRTAFAVDAEYLLEALKYEEAVTRKDAARVMGINPRQVALYTGLRKLSIVYENFSRKFQLLCNIPTAVFTG